MHRMSTNAEYAEMTIAKLLVKASARNERCLERMLQSIFFNLHGSGMRWSALQACT